MDYSINKAYIAANLCANKAKPAMRCEGKCQLKKKITQAEDAEHKAIPASIKEQEASYYLSYFELNMPELLNFLIEDFNGLPAEAPVISVSTSIFHPPQAA